MFISLCVHACARACMRARKTVTYRRTHSCGFSSVDTVVTGLMSFGSLHVMHPLLPCSCLCSKCVCGRSHAILSANVCIVRFVNRKCEDTCSQKTQSHGISHSERTARLNEACWEWVVCVSVCMCVSFYMGGLICGSWLFWTDDN